MLVQYGRVFYIRVSQKLLSVQMIAVASQLQLVLHKIPWFNQFIVIGLSRCIYASQRF